MTTTPADARLVAQTFPYSRYRGARTVLGKTWRHPAIQAVSKAILTVFITTTLTFFLIRLMPGNPVDLKIEELTRDGAFTYEEARMQAATLFQIDLSQPVWEQYVEFLGRLLRFDLGNSFLSQGTSVMSIVLAALPFTLFAVGTGLLLSFLAGILLGLYAAYHRNSAFDRAVSFVGSVVSSIPNYLVALMVILVLGVQTRLLPITQMRGAFTAGIEPGFTPAYIGDILFHASLPISVFFLTTIGHWILSMKSATISALEEDYVTAARARGLSDGRITTAYVGRNAVLPLVTQLAISAGFVVGGSILIENYFVYQGIGLRLVKAIGQRDYPVMQGILLMITLSVVVANLVADLLYSRLDPRIGRAGGSGG